MKAKQVQCVPASPRGPLTDPAVRRSRKRVYEKSGRRKPHGFKLETHCGNPQCIAEAHLKLVPWEMWGKSRGRKSAEIKVQ